MRKSPSISPWGTRSRCSRRPTTTGCPCCSRGRPGARDFVRYIIGILRERGVDKPISVGFSDDDEGNAQAVETFIEQELAREYPGVKFAVYYTNDPDLPAGRKVEVRGQLSLGL